MRRQLQKLIQLLFSPFDDINIRKVRIWQMQRYRKTLTVMKVRASYVSIPFGCVGERWGQEAIYRDIRTISSSNGTYCNAFSKKSRRYRRCRAEAFMQMILTLWEDLRNSMWGIVLLDHFHSEKWSTYDYQKKPKDRPIGRLGWSCKGIGKYVRLYWAGRSVYETSTIISLRTWKWKILHGFSDKEVAAHLGISETAVSSRASRGRSRSWNRQKGGLLHMTDQELDQLMQRVLLDAIKSDCSNMSCEIPNFMPSHRYQHQMAIMIANPLKWAHKRARPLWKKVLQRVAVILIVFSLSLGSLMIISPKRSRRSGQLGDRMVWNPHNI